MSAARFYLPELRAGNYVFSAEETRHITGAKRMRCGDVLEVFDGMGAYQEVRITALKSRDVYIEPQGEIIIQEKIVPQLEVAVAVPKSKRLQYMVEKLVELGVGKVTPLVCERSVAGGSDPVEKYRRWAIEACKQSRNPWIPEFSMPADFRDCITAAPGTAVMADYTGSSIAGMIAGGVTECLCLIGPEGGFTDDEFAFAELHGVKKVKLAPHILRIETAAVALVSSLMALTIIKNIIRSLPDSYNRGFTQNHSFTLDIHKRIAGTEIDTHIMAE